MSTPDRQTEARLAWLRAPLAMLLPGLDDPGRGRLALSLTRRVEALAAQAWSDMLQQCADLMPGAATVLQAIDSPPFDASLLLPNLPVLLTPKVLLCLARLDCPAIVAAMLAHPHGMVREQTLDGLLGECGCEALQEACVVGLRRLLIAELERTQRLSHSERLSLREIVLARPDAAAMERADCLQAGA